MNTTKQTIHRLAKGALLTLLAIGSVVHFAGVASTQEQPDNRPPRPDGQGRDREGGGGGSDRRGGGGGGGGKREMPENKTPVSPNPGQTVGLFLNTPKAYNGYTLFAPKHNMLTYLMNNAGQVCHSWKSEYEPGQTVYLLPNGHLIRACMLRVQGGTGGGEGGRIEEYDWDGKLVWEFDHATRDYQLHHDIKPLPNGNFLALMVERKSREQALAAGFDESMMRDDYLVPDAVVEIQPIRPKGGKIVWEWHVWDHLIQDSDRSKPNYGDPAQHPERIYVNCNGRAVAAFWNHMNSLDYNAKLDQIVLSVRGCNEIWIIDHSTTTQQAAGHTGGKHGKGGDLIYRWGNPAAYKRGTLKDKQLVQQHDALWIPDGYPGAGHMTIFNNGYDRGWSSVEEIVLPMDASGRYILEPGKVYGPAKPVWHYEAKNRTDFFSAEISGAHRLPNGNTLICGGIVGNLFEVTPTGEMVWQYVNAMVRGGILAQGELPGKDMRGHLWNAVFKVHRYEPNYPGLAGRDLTPKGVVELPASMKGKTGLHLMTEAQRTDQGPAGKGKGKGKGNRNRDNQREN
ncbi:MAG: aryl-sulfate sulfotransferase [Verrucomicrobia bacterium]|nr:aryl-sulfate sulfotransferase [Verrucomicrobiota bacterium]